jgi:hypothetical protein
MIGVVSQSMTRGCRGMTVLMMAAVVSNIGRGDLNVQPVCITVAQPGDFLKLKESLAATVSASIH